MEVIVTPEEARLLRKAAAAQDLSFSSWARTILLDIMRKRLGSEPDPPP
jgi:hypothetical protein